ncbi:MAG TPA: sigma-70 family RNA polymerase sigma factor [Ktedonobacteraceae bacterium]|jgi:RNA polymerase sigma factor (sigma-70 family)|nr:sigma-70 family RNA polymerase sigma factor [Ktedonobacteraceae bacterium]
MHSSHRGRKNDRADIPAGDGSVIAECYRQCASKMYAYLCRHVRTANDAEDLLFEVFLIAMEHEQKLVTMPEDERRAWLWMVARNKVIDYHRRSSRWNMIPLDHVAESIDDEATPDELALRHEECEHLHAYLKQLPVSQQEVLELRFIAGLRCAEIATILNKNEGAIRTMLSRALNTLRGIYGQ